jgi:hypothetical protein
MSKATITSFARSPCVVLHEEDQFNMTGNWIDAVVATRSKSGVFSVYARKYWETMGTPQSRKWTTLERWTGLRDCGSLIHAIFEAEVYLNLSSDLGKVTDALALLDAVISSQIARELGLDG